jgi:hypothetical protein
MCDFHIPAIVHWACVCAGEKCIHRCSHAANSSFCKLLCYPFKCDFLLSQTMLINVSSHEFRSTWIPLLTILCCWWCFKVNSCIALIFSLSIPCISNNHLVSASKLYVECLCQWTWMVSLFEIKWLCVCMCVWMCIQLYVYVYIQVCVHMPICVCVNVHVCVYDCMCVFLVFCTLSCTCPWLIWRGRDFWRLWNETEWVLVLVMCSAMLLWVNYLASVSQQCLMYKMGFKVLTIS